MRILHVFTLHSADNAFGGPIRVALNLAKAQVESGHKVELLGLVRGFSRKIRTVETIPSNLFKARSVLPAAGFSGLINLQVVFFTVINRSRFDVLHIHLARDLVTTLAAATARWLRIPYVIQTHGMITNDLRIKSRIWDKLFTIKTLEKARAVFYLTHLERAELLSISPNAKLKYLPNGVPIVTSTARSDSNHILFAARLHKRKNPILFLQVAKDLSTTTNFDFHVYGTDEGELPEVLKLIAEIQSPRVVYKGAVTNTELEIAFLDSLIFILPSVNEPFPMSVLEALSCGVPVIVTDTCGLASFVKESKTGVVVKPTSEEIQAAVVEIQENWSTYSANAKKMIEEKFNIKVISDLAVAQYPDKSQI
jgi:glycosyltransferase involved in cell wall biosynthesis